MRLLTGWPTQAGHLATALCAVLIASACPSAAQTTNPVELMLALIEGTQSVAAESTLREGQLIGCDLVFTAIHADVVYRQGAYIKVSGSIGVMTSRGQFGSTLKVTVQEIDPTVIGLGLKPSPPSRAYLVSSDLTSSLSSLINSFPSDTPGSLFSVFQLSPSFDIVLAALAENKLVVAFNSRDGATDIQLTIELDVTGTSPMGERSRSEKTRADFLACLRLLSE